MEHRRRKTEGLYAEEIVGRHFSVFYPPEAVATGWPDEELRRAARRAVRGRGLAAAQGRQPLLGQRGHHRLHEPAGPHGLRQGHPRPDRAPPHEEELRASEERFRLLVDSVRDYAMFMLDVDGTVRSWNAGAEALKGYTAAEIIGRHFSAFYTPQDQKDGKPAAELRAAKANGRLEDEGWRVRKDGTLFWANVVITAVTGAAAS